MRKEMTTKDIISQIAIPILSGASIWAFAGKRHKLGFTLGLCSQPFWFYSSVVAGQWGNIFGELLV